MISMGLQQAAASVEGQLHGQDSVFRGCSTDTRTLNGGELFIALKGDRYDGHDFIGQAMEAGAIAAMVETRPALAVPVIVVDDCRHAMNRLANAWRRQFRIPLVAITGSNGKTTVKELVAAILSLSGPVLSTRGNLNNDIGVPLTLFGLGEEHHFAVIEMGANHPGEIDALSRTAVPDVAVITQCAPAHLEGFGSVEGVARAKGEIYHGLGANGTAIINLDDDYAEYWLGQTRQFQQITFGLSGSAAVVARNARLLPGHASYTFELCIAGDSVNVTLNLPGRHNVQNALAAAACASALDIDLETIRQGLENFSGIAGRLQIKTGTSGCRVLDDSYNANPGSLRAGMDVLDALDGRHWLVLGDMGELGAAGRSLHHDMGEAARAAGIERLYGLGELSRAAVEGFGTGARHFDDLATLIDCLRSELSDDVAVLVKGSRSMQMERVVTALTAGDR